MMSSRISSSRGSTGPAAPDAERLFKHNLTTLRRLFIHFW